MKVRWTVRASKNLDKIIDYLENEWDVKTVQNFASKLLNLLETLKSKPEIGILVEKDKEIRAFVLTKQNTLFYRIKDQQIIILQLFDNRMNPKKRFFKK
ncbi:MAG TPA: type II toxin-antitoxin system RelE/ParE family toxin [Vicingus sp.]|nr:type II toxin-antitoxin system RelE/ParE family toxin [Vicingus sp.]HRP59772.1 type II toxin-antitoxin system RelE/ParE family toxin [Vicingus sp.]